MIKANTYGSTPVLTTKELSNLFQINEKVLSRNFQRNKIRYGEGKHYLILTGTILKEYKEDLQLQEALKYVSILYLWTKEGALLLAKSISSNEAWEVLDSLLEEVYGG